MTRKSDQKQDKTATKAAAKAPKLRLKKETMSDLSPKGEKSGAVKGGGGPRRTVCPITSY